MQWWWSFYVNFVAYIVIFMELLYVVDFFLQKFVLNYTRYTSECVATIWTFPIELLNCISSFYIWNFDQCNFKKKNGMWYITEQSFFFRNFLLKNISGDVDAVSSSLSHLEHICKMCQIWEIYIRGDNGCLIKYIYFYIIINISFTVNWHRRTFIHIVYTNNTVFFL